jgi:hypothetical protein
MVVNHKHHLSAEAPLVFVFLYYRDSHRSGSFSESVSIVIRAAVTWDAFARARLRQQSIASEVFFRIDSI